MSTVCTLLLYSNPFCTQMDVREKKTGKQLIVIMNNLSKTNDALRMIIEPSMEIGISYLMSRLNCMPMGSASKIVKLNIVDMVDIRVVAKQIFSHLTIM